MRPDMKHILVNTARSSSCLDYKVMVGKRHFKIDEDSPTTEKMRRKRMKGQSDRLKPLYRFLLKSVGRPWSEVYSEICKSNDRRNIRGNHVREHVWHYVQDNPSFDRIIIPHGEHAGKPALLPSKDCSRWWRYNLLEFFIDSNGILQRLSDVSGLVKKRRKERVRLSGKELERRKKEESYRKKKDTDAYMKELKNRKAIDKRAKTTYVAFTDKKK